MFWLKVALFLMIAYGGSASASSQSINVSGIVASPPPTAAPFFTLPQQNVTVREKSFAVSGECQADLVVKIFRNSDFAGSALCGPNGTFSLTIDLLDGQNDLIARQYDSLNQSSPDSKPVTVFYVPSGLPLLDEQLNSEQAVARFQLVVDYDQTVQSIFKGQTFRLPIRFSGGLAPYAVAIDWGDGETSLFSRSDDTAFAAEHIYNTDNFKTISIKVSDSAGNQAALEFVVLVQGKPAQPSFSSAEKLLGIPFAAGALGIGISLALGFIGGVFFALWFWAFKK